ncbi:hypothetical protein [Xanthomonas arboricola]|uniref:hypothetical protein n=1 Tax=Xanthomonas arboricola TaxID=56448 RepID=UPI0015E3C767|nr:hypothetical protein [Xanthomonas arboricola]
MQPLQFRKRDHLCRDIDPIAEPLQPDEQWQRVFDHLLERIYRHLWQARTKGLRSIMTQRATY